jgi:hypothetical protein
MLTLYFVWYRRLPDQHEEAEDVENLLAIGEVA